MSLVLVPEAGLKVVLGNTSRDEVSTTGTGSKSASKQPFVMRINVTEKMIKDILEGKSGDSLTLTTGKSLTLGLGNQSQFEVIPTRETITQELFRLLSTTPSSLNSMGFSQQKLEVLEIEDKGEFDSDANLVQALKNQYQALGQHKKERSAVLVDDPRDLPPALSGKRGMIARKKAGLLRGTERDGLTTQSTPNSPAINALNSPNLSGITSAPLNHLTVKKDPLYIPLIHLLALGSDTEKKLAMKTHTTLKRCSEALIYMGNRTKGGNHWELTDMNYKDLDVWRFPYPSSADRDLAIANATKAYDKLRLSRNAPEREMLRKPEDRGKPLPETEMSLPVPASTNTATSTFVPSATTPIIKITGSESEHKEDEVQNPQSEPLARSSSSQSLQKPKKASEMEAVSKIILNGKNNMKGRPKAPTRQTTKENSEGVKARKPSAARTGAKPGRKPAKEYKSAEIITDSDSDMEDVLVAPTVNTTEPKPATPLPGSKDAVGPPTSLSKLVSSPKPSVKSTIYKAGQNTTLTQKDTHMQSSQTNSKSPSLHETQYRSASFSPNKKPSPLGSSPVINASDAKSHYRSPSSASSLSSIQSGDDMSTPTPISAYTSAPTSKMLKSTTTKDSAKPRYMPTPNPENTPSVQQKRKAPQEEIKGQPARKTVKTSTNASDGNVSEVSKKKSLPNGVENGVCRNSKAGKTPSEVDPISPRKRKLADSDANPQQSPKIARPSYASSTTSSTSSSSDVILRKPLVDRRHKDSVPSLDERTVLLAKRFRENYAKYQRLYKEVASIGKPPQSKLDEVLNLHKKLESMKARINASIA